MKAKTALALLVGLAFVAMGTTPAFADGWQGGAGDAEPSTVYDTAQYIQQSPNTEGKDEIYFNGQIVSYNIARLGSQHNADGGTVQPAVLMQGHALLGVWRDCNDDGYIGNKEAPAFYGSWSSYPLAVYGADVNTDTCPGSSDHNDGKWIHEFRAIGPNADGSADEYKCEPGNDDEGAVDRAFDCYAKARYDHAYRKADRNIDSGDYTNSTIWFDFGIPDGSAGESRNVFERGYLQDSDGTLSWTDFWLGKALEELSEEGETVNEPITGTELVQIPATHFWSSKPNVGGCDEKESGEYEGEKERQLGGGDNGTCGLYPLYQVKRLYNDSDHETAEAQPLVTTWDDESACNSNSVPVGDDTIYTQKVKPGVHTNALMEGSFAGTYEHFWGGFDNYDESAGNCGGKDGAWQDEISRDYNDNLETAGSTPEKTRVNSGFSYNSDRTASRSDLEGAPVDAFNTFEGGYWSSIYIYIFVPPSGGTASYRFGATFYSNVEVGQVGLNDDALPGDGAEFNYGAEQCGDDFDQGKDSELSFGGWRCDRDRWEQRLIDDGWEGDDRWAIVGDPYNLRDVDCLDGTVTRQDVDGNDVEPRASLTEVYEQIDQLTANDMEERPYGCEYAPYGGKPVPGTETGEDAE